MTTPKLKTVFRPLGHTSPLLDGTVKPKGFEIDFIEVPVLVKAFRRMVRGLEFDICEMAMTTYICAKAHGKPFTALPIFPARGLHHSAIIYNKRLGIHTPKDLEGKIVGVNRGYTVTTGVWARGILHAQYGVDLDKVTWMLSGDEHVEEFQEPSNVVSVKQDTSLEELLIEGKIAAAIGIQIDHPDITTLIQNPNEIAMTALREQGLFPINHTVVVRDELLTAHQGLAVDIFNAFADAKHHYIEELKAGRITQPTKADQLNQQIMSVTGDPLPYGIESNRKMLELLRDQALNQHIISKAYPIEELFAKGTYDLTA